MLAECARAADRRELLVRAREKERGPSECSGSNRSIRAVSGVGRNTQTYTRTRTHSYNTRGYQQVRTGDLPLVSHGPRHSRSPSPSGPTSVRKGRPLFAIRRVRNRCAIRLSRLEANIIKYILLCPESRTIGYVKLKQGVSYHRHSSRLFIFI